MRCRTFCSYCYDYLTRGNAHKGHEGYAPPRARYRSAFFGVEAMLKKRTSLPLNNPEGWSPAACGLPGLESLTEFLFCPIWPEDGSKRDTGTIMLFADDGKLKAVITDRAQSLVAFFTISEPTLLWDELNEALLGDSLDWRVKKEWSPGNKKK